MADYAQIIDNVVAQMLVVADNSPETEAWLEATYGGTWVPCNLDDVVGSKCAVGSEYDAETGRFIPVPEFPSWVFDRESWAWQAPVSYPSDGEKYMWDEQSGAWILPPPLLD